MSSKTRLAAITAMAVGISAIGSISPAQGVRVPTAIGTGRPRALPQGNWDQPGKKCRRNPKRKQSSKKATAWTGKR